MDSDVFELVLNRLGGSRESSLQTVQVLPNPLSLSNSASRQETNYICSILFCHILFSSWQLQGGLNILKFLLRPGWE